MKEINLESNYMISESTFTKTILTATFNLSKELILEILKHEHIYINGNYYIVPEHTLMGCLLNRQYLNIRLDLEQVKI